MGSHKCRSCAGSLSTVLDLGRVAPSRRFLDRERAAQAEPIFPLRLMLCESCRLLQLDAESDSAAALPGYSPASADNEAFAQQLTERHEIRDHDLILEIGPHPRMGQAFRLCGVVSRGVADFAGICRESARSARLILGGESILREPDLPGYLEGLERVLAADGLAMFEIPNLANLFKRLAYDEIRHESLYYFSINGICTVMARHGLEVVDVSLTPDGRTYRVTIQREGGPVFARPAVGQAIARDQTAFLHRSETWADFAQLVEQSRDLLMSELEDWLYREKRVVAYTRDGHGMTILSYCGIDSTQVPYVVDENADLHGELTPGHRIPIREPDLLRRDPPDVLLALCPIGEHSLEEYLGRDGRVLVPLPKPHYWNARATAARPEDAGVSFAEYS